MECQSSDSKKIFKVFDATKRKRTRKKQEDDTISVATDNSNAGCEGSGRRVSSAKASFQDITSSKTRNIDQDISMSKRESSMSMPRSPVDTKRHSRSPRRHRRSVRDGVSLALKAGLVSTPRSLSPQQDCERALESVPHDQDSFIYAFLEEAVKRDKKKHRHVRRREERPSRERDESPYRPHRKRREEPAHKENKHDKPKTEEIPQIDQAVLLETFAKLYAQMQSNPKSAYRSHSHKSLQCEVVSRRSSHHDHHRPEPVRSREHSKHNLSPTRIRSHDDCRSRVHDKVYNDDRHQKVYSPPYDDCHSRYGSRANIAPKHEDDRFRDYGLKVNPTRCCIEKHKNPQVSRMEFPQYYERRDGIPFDEHKKLFEQKASRSFDVQRDRYDDDRMCPRTARSSGIRERPYESDYRDRRYVERNYRDNYAVKELHSRDYVNMQNKVSHQKRNTEFDRASVASKEYDFRERDKYSERERDSGLSVADGETSTLSGKSNYLRVVKQEIIEQREAMDKMMQLWKELMRCFKGTTQAQGAGKSANECAANVRDSAAAQLRLWRECMRRYETVAKDVGDTDARLMEEITKQRSEMAEMASMWQECLQRYRDMSNDFNSLKKQLVTSDSPSRMAAPSLVCAEGEGLLPPTPYHLSPNYVQPVAGPGPYVPGGPLKAHASAPPGPPPWWWAERAPSPRRRSSPDSRASHDRHHRHRDRDRDDTRYKEKSKPSTARSEHRHRKR